MVLVVSGFAVGIARSASVIRTRVVGVQSPGKSANTFPLDIFALIVVAHGGPSGKAFRAVQNKDLEQSIGCATKPAGRLRGAGRVCYRRRGSGTCREPTAPK